MGRKVYVVGVGMTKFEKPGSKEGWDYPQMAKESGTKALEDAGIPYDAVEQVAVGYCYGDSTCGQRAVYEIGLSGVPIYNVNNNCATGSTALFMAKQFIEGGLADCCMALGFEKMERGSLGTHFTDRTNPMDKHAKVHDREARLRQGSAGPAVLRQRRSRAHGEVRHHRRALRQDRLEEPQALGEQPVLAIPGRVLAGGHQEREDDLRARSPSCSAARRPTAPAPRSWPARSSCASTTSRTRPWRSRA